jgi:hypothetical protein
MTAIRDVPAGFSSAISGIQRAVERIERSAENVSSAGPAAVLHISDEARAAAERAPSLEESLIDSRIASHDLAANVRTLQTSDEMTHALLAMFGNR